MIRLLMTRPRAAAERFVAELNPQVQERVQTIYSPLLDIQPDESQIDLNGVAGLIFTSSNGVAIASRKLTGRALPSFCVGANTARAASQAGWPSEMAGETAETLIATLLAKRPETPLLHLRGAHSRGDIAETLNRSGLTVREQVIYRQELLPFSQEAEFALAENIPVIAPLFSPRTARQFASLPRGAAPVWVVALSEAVAEPLVNQRFARLGISKHPTPDEMRKAVEKMVKRANRVEGRIDAH